MKKKSSLLVVDIFSIVDDKNDEDNSILRKSKVVELIANKTNIEQYCQFNRKE